MEKKTLYRYFGNCATEEERIQVLEWTKASPENLKEFCRERNIYNAILLSTDNIQRTKYDFRRHYRAQLLRIAAVVILLLSVAFGSFYLTMGDRIVPLYSLTVPSRIFSKACCTPSPDTSRVSDGLSLLRAILSISSIKTIPRWASSTS